MTDKKEEIAPLVVRDSKGRILKGSVMNPKGIKKKEDVQKRLLEEAKKQELSDAFYEELKKFKNNQDKMDYIINYLLVNAKTKDELFKYSKEFVTFFKAKMQSIESSSKEEKIITINWTGLPQSTPDTKVIEVEAVAKEIGLKTIKESLDVEE